MIKTLFDIDYLAQYEPYHISRKRGKVREMEYKRKVDKKRIPTCNIMGVNIAAINMEWLVDYLEKNISEIKGDYFKSFLLFPDLIKIVTSTLKKKG